MIHDSAILTGLKVLLCFVWSCFIKYSIKSFHPVHSVVILIHFIFSVSGVMPVYSSTILVNSVTFRCHDCASFKHILFHSVPVSGNDLVYIQFHTDSPEGRLGRALHPYRRENGKSCAATLHGSSITHHFKFWHRRCSIVKKNCNNTGKALKNVFASIAVFKVQTESFDDQFLVTIIHTLYSTVCSYSFLKYFKIQLLCHSNTRAGYNWSSNTN